MAIWRAWQSGLSTAGIMDHDSVSGALEFIEAGQIIGMPTTIGCECRVDMSKTKVAGRRINNPDQDSVAYVAIHGLPHQNIYVIDTFFERCRRRRNERNLAMCRKLDEVTRPYGISIDFKRDVLPLSCAWEGGAVTERHICFALAKKLVARYPLPELLIGFFDKEMKLNLSGRAARDPPRGEAGVLRVRYSRDTEIGACAEVLHSGDKRVPGRFGLH